MIQRIFMMGSFDAASGIACQGTEEFDMKVFRQTVLCHLFEAGLHVRFSAVKRLGSKKNQKPRLDVSNEYLVKRSSSSMKASLIRLDLTACSCFRWHEDERLHPKCVKNLLNLGRVVYLCWRCFLVIMLAHLFSYVEKQMLPYIRILLNMFFFWK